MEHKGLKMDIIKAIRREKRKRRSAGQPPLSYRVEIDGWTFMDRKTYLSSFATCSISS